MTFEQLEYFIAVAEQPTFFDAAETMHITQSALSKQIMKLERELGVSLLDRSHRSAELTETGKLFYQEALNLSASYHHMLQQIRIHQVRHQTELRIGTLPILAQYHLSSLFKAFQEGHPQISLQIDEVEENALLHRFEEGGYDLIIARRQMLPGRRYATQLLVRDELVVILPVSHPLLQDGHIHSIAPSSLAHENMILMNPYTSIYQQCLDIFKKAGIAPPILRTARIESIIGAVSVGEGISLLAKSNFEVFHHENVTALPLQPSIPLPVILATKKDCPKGSPAYLLKQFLAAHTR